MKPTIALMNSEYKFILFDGSQVHHERYAGYKNYPEIEETLAFMKDGGMSATSGYNLLSCRDEQKGVAVELAPERLVIATPMKYVQLYGRTRRVNEGVAFYIKEREGYTDIVEELKSAHNAIFANMNPAGNEPLIGDLESEWLESVYSSVTGVGDSCATKRTEHPESNILSDKPLVVDYKEIVDGTFDTKIPSGENMLVFFATSGVVPGSYINQCDVIVTHKDEYLRTLEERKRKNNEPFFHPPKKKSLVSKFRDMLRR